MSGPVRCCGCGDMYSDPTSPAALTATAVQFSYRMDTEHVPAGPYMPSITYARRHASPDVPVAHG